MEAKFWLLIIHLTHILSLGINLFSHNNLTDSHIFKIFLCYINHIYYNVNLMFNIMRKKYLIMFSIYYFYIYFYCQI